LNWPSELAPVTFNQNPFAVPMLPAMSHPHRVVMGGTFPAAGGPDIVVAFPAVIAGDPNKSALRRIATTFSDRGWRTFTMVVLRKGSRRHQAERKQHRQCNLLDHGKTPFRFPCRGGCLRVQIRCVIQRRTTRKVVVRESGRQSRNAKCKHTRASPLPGMRAWRLSSGASLVN